MRLAKEESSLLSHDPWCNVLNYISRAAQFAEVFAVYSPIVEQRGSVRRMNTSENYLSVGSLGLRAELCTLALCYAASNASLFETTDGGIPSIVFGLDELGRHGNFHPASFQGIQANPRWARRLDKVHTSSKRQSFRSNWRWRELDCANSSDALLMNIFCFPGVMSGRDTRRLLGVADGCNPQFGVKPRVPLLKGKRDGTEIDMEVGDLLIEAKLTESGFQQAHPRLIERYRDFEDVFDRSVLPIGNGKYLGYQLIRDVLAAYATGKSFCVLLDARRADLAENWFSVMRAVRYCELRSRLKLLTWQELASTLPADLQRFLDEKYGIRPRSIL
jgi:hypothetical protein